MGLLDQKTSHVADLETVPAGEQQLNIIEAEEVEFSTGRPGIELVYEIVNHPNAGYVYHRVMGLMEGDSERKADGMLRRMRAFKKAHKFGPDDPVDTDSLVGVTCFAFLNEEDTDTGKRNTIRSFSVSQAD